MACLNNFLYKTLSMIVCFFVDKEIVDVIITNYESLPNTNKFAKHITVQRSFLLIQKKMHYIFHDFDTFFVRRIEKSRSKKRCYYMPEGIPNLIS